MESKWFNFRAAADSDAVEVLIYDEIGIWGVDAETFLKEFKSIPENKQVTLRLNSPGGSVFDGWGIFQAVKERGNVTVMVDGLAASMASVIAMAGSKIKMSEGAMLMIHNPWSLAIGDAEAMRHEADVLDKIKEGIVGAYASRADLSNEDIRMMMDEETWLTAPEALEQGFISEVVSFSEKTQAAQAYAKAIHQIADKWPEQVPSVLTSLAGGMSTEAKDNKISKPEEQNSAVATQESSDSSVTDSAEAVTEEIPKPIGGHPAGSAPVSDISQKIQARFDAFETEISNLKTSLADAEKDVETFKAEAQQVKDEMKRLEALAGVAPATEVPEVDLAAGSAKTSNELWDEYRELKSKGKFQEASAFYREHKAEMTD
ncbi:MAG: head maturation protease, ClpP-related [Verrucomicrobiota bacterium]